jgi:hypothetical protein
VNIIRGRLGYYLRIARAIRIAQAMFSLQSSIRQSAQIAPRRQVRAEVIGVLIMPIGQYRLRLRRTIHRARIYKAKAVVISKSVIRVSSGGVQKIGRCRCEQRKGQTRMRGSAYLKILGARQYSAYHRGYRHAETTSVSLHHWQVTFDPSCPVVPDDISRSRSDVR